MNGPRFNEHGLVDMDQYSDEDGHALPSWVETAMRAPTPTVSDDAWERGLAGIRASADPASAALDQRRSERHLAEVDDADPATEQRIRDLLRSQPRPAFSERVWTEGLRKVREDAANAAALSASDAAVTGAELAIVEPIRAPSRRRAFGPRALAAVAAASLVAAASAAVITVAIQRPGHHVETPTASADTSMGLPLGGKNPRSLQGSLAFGVGQQGESPGMSSVNAPLYQVNLARGETAKIAVSSDRALNGVVVFGPETTSVLPDKYLSYCSANGYTSFVRYFKADTDGPHYLQVRSERATAFTIRVDRADGSAPTCAVRDSQLAVAVGNA